MAGLAALGSNRGLKKAAAQILKQVRQVKKTGPLGRLF
jgi:hypothetical protein